MGMGRKQTSGRDACGRKLGTSSCIEGRRGLRREMTEINRESQRATEINQGTALERGREATANAFFLFPTG